MAQWSDSFELHVGDSKSFSSGPLDKLEITASIHPLFRYCLVIDANQHGDFYFNDKTGDRYHITIHQNVTSHYIRFRSDKPTIISAEYWP